MIIISLSTPISYEWVILYHCPQQHLMNGRWRWLLCHCPHEHLMNGWWVVSIISLSTTTSYEWVRSDEYYIIVHNNISWMGDEWWLLYHCPQQHLMNGWWVVSIISLSHKQHHCILNGWWVMSIISLSTTTSYEWVIDEMSDYYIIVHNNIYYEWVMSGDEYYIIVHNNILWMGDEWWLLYHCPQQHLMNGWWVVSIISLSTTTSIEWVMSGEYYIIVQNNILWMGEVVSIISLSTTTSYECAMSDEYYIIVHSYILWMGDEWWVLYHCPQQRLLNGWWVVNIISLSTTTS